MQRFSPDRNTKNSSEKPVLANHQQEVNNCNDSYHALFEQATDAIMVTDFHGNFIDVNSSICTMFGYTKQELLLLNVKTLLDAEILQLNPLRFDLLSNGENIFNERKMVHKNGAAIYVEANAKKFMENRVMVIARDITERKKVEEVLQKSEANLEKEKLKAQQEITDAVITVQENERHQIGLELHDNVNQLLATSRLYLRIAKRGDIEKKTMALNEVDKLIDNAIGEIRNLSHSLISPFLKCHGLADSLGHLLKTISNSNEIIIEKEIKNIDENAIPEKLKLSIYRIIQEQLGSIIKYARPSTIHIKLIQENERIFLSVKDDGIGFNIADKTEGIGLINIRTRASLFDGEVSIISSPGNGCELTVAF
ncbi:MAG: PAS domain S-box protein [Ginsengibacter sp.]